MPTEYGKTVRQTTAELLAGTAEAPAVEVLLLPVPALTWSGGGTSGGSWFRAETGELVHVAGDQPTQHEWLRYAAGWYRGQARRLADQWGVPEVVAATWAQLPDPSDHWPLRR